MYGLPQAGIIAQQLLEKRLALKGYRQSSITPGFWKHDWRPISFTLCVDDFVSNMLASNMHSTFYKLSTNTTKLAWDYTLQQVQLSMPGYCKKPATAFTTLFPSNHSINPILIHPALMAPNNSLSTLRMTQRYSPTPTKPSSRKSSASSCTTHELWTAPCYLHWGPLPPNNRHQHRIPCRKYTSSSTTP
eukprot:CCRYP_015775-RH/>CCRYP_015775-RH protein AED:0.43 eAED:0.64 QI:0/0/0/1/0/0/2/0/188